MADLLKKLKAPHHLRQQLGGLLFLGLILFSRHGATPAELRWALPTGTALFLLGLAGRIWSSGFLVKNDLLTTTGPYGRVRNPIYVSNLLLGAGLVLLSGLYAGAALVALLYAVCYVPGMRVEEENLRRRYGPAFDSYAKAVPLILPRCTTASGYGGDRWNAGAYVENKEWPVTLGLVIGFAAVLWRRLAV